MSKLGENINNVYPEGVKVTEAETKTKVKDVDPGETLIV